MSYWVYIVSSASKALYVGMTNDLRRRMREHKSGEASSHSTKYRTQRLVYCKDFRQVEDAMRAEKQIKGWRREKKVLLIETDNPEWNDLAEDMN